jgi:hypothetical protein
MTGRCGLRNIATPRRKADWSAVASVDDDDDEPRVDGERRDSIVDSVASCATQTRMPRAVTVHRTVHGLSYTLQ